MYNKNGIKISNIIMEETNMTKYECQTCGYIYDPELGDPDNNVDPGTSFDNLPADWTCPLCGVEKDMFEAC